MSQSYGLKMQDLGPVQCFEHRHCSRGDVCEYYMCASYGCNTEISCPAGLACSQDNVCVQCIGSADCPLGDVCVDEECEFAGLRIDEEELNNSALTANPVPSLPARVAGSVALETDADWYVLTVDRAGTLSASTTPGTSGRGDTSLWLYSDAGETLVASDDDGGPGRLSLLEYDVEPGEVWLRLGCTADSDRCDAPFDYSLTLLLQ